MIYLVNSKLIPNDGTFVRKTISASECWESLKHGEFVSTIGYPETAMFIAKHIGKPVLVDRGRVSLEVGDAMIAVSLKYRVRDPKDKGKVFNLSENDYEYCKISRIK